jgi:eukaryotic-like serine/threonine-protein kinase
MAPDLATITPMLIDARKELWDRILDGQYQLGRPLGKGGSAVVFAARAEDGRRVAVKMLLPREAHVRDLCERLRIEAAVPRAVHHPGLVACLGEGALYDGSPYVVFERVVGQSLLELLKSQGPLPTAEAVVIFRGVARVLAAVHAAGYVHRDVKPEHVLLSEERGMLRVHLIDFGVCQPSSAWPGNLREQGRVFGTPGYAAPEQILSEGRIDARADLFALGATMYQALSGLMPFGDGNAAVLMRRTLEYAPVRLSRLRADVPAALDTCVTRLLARSPDERPLNARVVERAMTQAVDTDLARAEMRLLGALTQSQAWLRAGGTVDTTPTRAL